MEKFHFILYFRQIFFFAALACASSMAQKQTTTPVPILKQINRHNEDGSYSYGYEGADGSYKIETKSAAGEVKGKYGYVDDSGNLREIEYGANQDGFHPTGTGINVAPAAPHNPSNAYPSLQDGEIDDGQYREDPNMYNDPKYNSKPSRAQNNFQFKQNRPAPAPAPARNYNQQSFFEQSPAPAAPAQQAPRAQFPAQTPRPYYQPEYQQPQPNYYQQPQQSYQPQQNYQQPQQQNYYQPQQNYQQSQSSSYYRNSNQPEVNIFHGHPAQNLNLQTGSYTLQYGRKK